MNNNVTLDKPHGEGVAPLVRALRPPCLLQTTWLGLVRLGYFSNVFELTRTFQPKYIISTNSQILQVLMSHLLADF